MEINKDVIVSIHGAAIDQEGEHLSICFKNEVNTLMIILVKDGYK